MCDLCHRGQVTVYCDGSDYVLGPLKSYCDEIFTELIKALRAISKENGFDADLEEIIFENDNGQELMKGDVLICCNGETDFEAVSEKLQREKTALCGSFSIERTIWCSILVLLTDMGETATEETGQRSLSYLQSILEALSGTNINSPFILRLITKNRSKFTKSGLISYRVKDVRTTQRGERYLLEMQIDFTFHAEYDCHRVGG